VQPLGPADREYLGDRTAGIVRDQIDVGQFERVAEAGDEPGQAWQWEGAGRAGWEGTGRTCRGGA